MAVYTPLDTLTMSEFLRRFGVGGLREHRGSAAGIENTTYFVTTDAGEFVLTIFEQLDPELIPFFLELNAFLAEHGIPSAHPVPDQAGRYLQKVRGKPAALFVRLPGQSVTAPRTPHCAAIGAALGRMHVALRDFPLSQPNPRGYAWQKAAAARLGARLGGDDRSMLEDEVRFQNAGQGLGLPRGVIHGDLFHDNALFLDDRLTGIIDFYFAGSDALLLDVAVTINDWCSRSEGGLDPERVGVTLRAYAGVRPFTPGEQASLPRMLRAAALRFWLSRLEALHFPMFGDRTATKDPDEYKRLLLWHGASADDLVGLMG